MGMVSYGEGVNRARTIKHGVQMNLSTIATADAVYQQQTGITVSQLSPDAQQASARVVHKGNQELAKLSADVAAANDPASVRQVSDLKAATAALIKTIEGLQPVERARAEFLAEAQQPSRPRLFNADLVISLRDFEVRCQRVFSRWRVRQGSRPRVR